jgi:hypothetical protein
VRVTDGNVLGDGLAAVCVVNSVGGDDPSVLGERRVDLAHEPALVVVALHPSFLLPATGDVGVDHCRHSRLVKFREEFVYPLHKSGGGKIVGAFNENTEPRDFYPPLGQGRFPLLA